jgi:hypothetical protein
MISDKVYRQQSCQVEIWALPPDYTVYHPIFRKYLHKVLISESDKVAKRVRPAGFDNMPESEMFATALN